MKIVIDTSPLRTGHKTRGIGRYTSSLINALKKIDKKDSIILTSELNSVENIDVVHYPYFDLFHSKLPFLKPAKAEIITIHDLIPLKFSDYFKPGLKSGINLFYQKWKIKRMDAIITDSNCSQQDIISLLGASKEKVHVIYLGVDKLFKTASKTLIESVQQKYNLPQNYLLYVGDINPNKNLSCLIEALADLNNISLVIVSQALKNKNTKEAEKIYFLINKLNLVSRVIIISDLAEDSTDKLAAIYSAAAIYVQPSWYEGFGLPILEAMACGTPVVSSNAASLPEIVGKAGLLVSPTKDGLISGIKKMLNDENIRKKYSMLGLNRSKLFTWEKTALQTLKIYEKYS